MIIKEAFNALRRKSSFKKIASNISWLTFEKAFHMALGLLVGIWFARYLGPELYGTFNYAFSIIALFTVFTTLGLNNIVVREIVKAPELKNAYMGTAFLMMFFGGILAYLISILVINIIEPDNILTRWLVIIMGFQLILNSFKVIEFWFQSQVLSKNTVIAKNLSLLFVSAAKVYLIIINAQLISFAYLTALGAFLSAILLVVVYKFNGQSVKKWTINLSVGKSLIKDSWPLIFAGLSVSVYMKIDQVMVGNMLGEYALGNYSVAVKLTEVWYFIPMAIVASVYPSIIKYKGTSEKLYLNRLQQLYFIMTWLAIAIALPTTFLSKYVIHFLYGAQYSLASDVLVIYVWSAVPVFLGVASGSYLMTENLAKISLFRTLVGAIVNVSLNLMLIPILGLTGAAITTLISYTIATFYLVLIKKTRKQAILMLKTIIFWKFRKAL